MSLIQEMNERLQEQDPVKQALAETDGFDPTSLDDGQIQQLAAHARELLDNGQADDLSEAAYQSLEDGPGIETADSDYVDSVVARIVQAAERS